jgi:hypothetical protein
MAIRAGHGQGAGTPHVEVLPADELPEGVQREAINATKANWRPGGGFAPGNVYARAGGLAKAGKSQLAGRLGLSNVPQEAEFRPYKGAANGFRKSQCAALAASVGGGHCGPAVSSLVASASLQLAWSRYLYDKAALTGDAEVALQASKLSDASRQNLLAAHELCAKEAMARRERAPTQPHALLAEALAAGDASVVSPAKDVDSK